MKTPKALSHLLSLFFPARCHLCGHPLPGTREYLCAGCLADLPRASYSLPNNPVSEALALIAGGDCGTAFLRYAVNNDCSALIHDFKYRGFKGLARMLGREAAEELSATGFFRDVDLLLPVPLHRSKLRKRGYNQALEIAKGIGEVTGVPVGRNLSATRNHGTQTRLSRSARMDNVEGVFEVLNPRELDGMTVMIVDDVFTTGATLLTAARAIVESSQSVRVKIFALASAHS